MLGLKLINAWWTGVFPYSHHSGPVMRNCFYIVASLRVCFLAKDPRTDVDYISIRSQSVKLASTIHQSDCICRLRLYQYCWLHIWMCFIERRLYNLMIITELARLLQMYFHLSAPSTYIKIMMRLAVRHTILVLQRKYLTPKSSKIYCALLQSKYIETEWYTYASVN